MNDIEQSALLVLGAMFYVFIVLRCALLTFDTFDSFGTCDSFELKNKFHLQTHVLAN